MTWIMSKSLNEMELKLLKSILSSLPITNDCKEIIGHNAFRGRMVIRCDGREQLYLYDIIDIKKET